MSTPDSIFKKRVIEQGWAPGMLIPWAGELAREIEHKGIKAADMTLPAGAPAPRRADADGQFILISQLCDLVAPASTEPFITVIPAGPWIPGQKAPRLPNSPRYFRLGRCLVATQARIIQVEKNLLPDEVAWGPDGIGKPIETPSVFAAWLARRWRRTAFPDDLVETIIQALRDVFEEQRNVADWCLDCRLSFVSSHTVDVHLLFDSAVTELAQTTSCMEAFMETLGSALDTRVAAAQARAAADGRRFTHYEIGHVKPLPHHTYSIPYRQSRWVMVDGGVRSGPFAAYVRRHGDSCSGAVRE